MTTENRSGKATKMKSKSGTKSKKAKMSGYQRYKATFKVQCENFESDPHLSTKDKARFKSHWSGFNSGDISAFANKFFYDVNNHQLGPTQNVSLNESLGHLRSLNSMARRLTDFTNLGLDLHQAKKLIRDLAFLKADSLRRRLRRMFPSGETAAAFLMWSYRNPSQPTDAFDGINIADLPCRLALNTFGYTEHVALSHKGQPGLRYATPTAFDAGLFAEWSPGGMTKPLPACSATYPDGLPEVVHAPVAFVSIVSELKIV